MSTYEFYDWTSLIDSKARSFMCSDIDNTIASGKFWHNSPPYQTNINVFGITHENWVNLKMSFIWSAFAYMAQERQIKSIKSWGYKTNIDTQEDRDNYWHQHLRPPYTVLSGVFYLKIPEGANLETSGTELAIDKPEGETLFCPAKLGHWLIFPGKTWHRPGILESKDWRYIVAADMEV
jgi:hypothetical protein